MAKFKKILQKSEKYVIFQKFCKIIKYRFIATIKSHFPLLMGMFFQIFWHPLKMLGQP
jgi:hypothetical protein